MINAHETDKVDRKFTSSLIFNKYGALGDVLDTKPLEQSTICDQCGKVFDNSRSLRTHIRKSHNNTKVFPCDVCNKIFFHKDKFVGHKMKVHLKLRPFKCRHCDYTSAARSTIYRHCDKRHGQRGILNKKNWIKNINFQNTYV